MADRHTPKQRSYNMQMIKGSNTKPELLLRKSLFAKGFRYRINDKKLPGKPDLVFRKFKTVIFVHGCFWHGHENCRYYVVPKTRTEFWTDKIAGNKERDCRSIANLEEMGWRVIIVWECELKKNSIEETVSRIAKKIISRNF